MSVTATPGLEALQPTHHGSWEPRRALALDVARRRTAFVRWLRLVFMAGAIGILILLTFQLVMGSLGPTEGDPQTASSEGRMTNPRFTGRDESLTPYAITADVAIRREGSAPGVTELERPRLDYDFLAGDSSRVLAETGFYDLPNRTLDLHSSVNLSTPEGYSFASNHARIHLREERVTGEEPVQGTGPMGTIRADRYEIRDGGDHIVFEGNVRARLIQDRTAPVPAETAPREENQ
ncbi:MAG: LPS export ABC transporter periplasmic protein LptC [Alphaproteobacteria bacterium]|uniref:LPS export ABC transporter periplasmic protein LptC n=1 Tax=Maricaulis alexandrii TaxID=2570354 RepID=UPI001107E249|nr:LPS export ABC transporter periplasmic protein LptC [Maricaulis alexandrii]MCR9266638.1 LPS export ABC transporter periplasmic protein LptC [Alphaproteobacteria bacterium]